MFIGKKQVHSMETSDVRVLLREGVVKSIFDECERYDAEETGGRLVGFYKYEQGQLTIDVAGVIEPGPHARRTATSFFQDGEYQEHIFRDLESTYPELEHLGNWHTHHVNGLQTLSGGDAETYMRVVNHSNHNTDFFYALLVTARTGDGYETKHFLFRRGKPAFHQIPSGMVQVTSEPAIGFPSSRLPKPDQHSSSRSHTITRALSGADTSDRPDFATPGDPNKSEHVHVTGRTKATHGTALTMEASNVRFADKTVISVIYPKIRPYQKKDTGMLYWRGILDLTDDRVEILVAESSEQGRCRYRVLIKQADASRFRCAPIIENHVFDSASLAIRKAEQQLNLEILNCAKTKEN